jgi:hypothetical protein
MNKKIVNEKSICELNIVNASASSFISPIPTPMTRKALTQIRHAVRLMIEPIPSKNTKIQVRAAKILR